MKIKSLLSPLNSSFSDLYFVCICELYGLFYGPRADFSSLHSQDTLKDLVHQILDSNQTLCEELEIYEKKAKASEVISSLIKANWLESYEDKPSLQKSFRFTKEGKVMAQTLYELSNGFYTRKSRSVRSTRACLESFYKERNVDYLLDAWSYSMQIMQEFEDLINEIHEKRKQLLQSMATSEAVELFLKEMQKKERELQQKLKTDSVLRYSEDIHAFLDRIQHEFPQSFWDSLNPAILNETGEVFAKEANPGFFITTKIREHIEVAIEKKNPELTQALNFFVTRTRSLLKTSINLASAGKDLHEALERFHGLEASKKNAVFENLEAKFSGYKIRIPSFENLSVPKKVQRVVQTQINEESLPKHLLNQSAVRARVNEKLALSAVQVKDWIKKKAELGELELKPEDLNSVIGVLKSSLFLDGLKANDLVGVVQPDVQVQGLVQSLGVKQVNLIDFKEI